MSTQSVLLIILAAILALGLSLFQYFFKAKRTRLAGYLAFLRFLSWFMAFLLLINPKITKEDYYIEKPNLVLAVDNSKSIGNIGGIADSELFMNGIVANEDLDKRFDIHTYFFDKNLSEIDSASFGGEVSDISAALRNLNDVFGTTPSAFVVLTDGNQNVGADYEFERLNAEVSLFPIVVGDTTKFEDLYISQLNLNRYTFLDNQFPFEVNISYSGSNRIDSELLVNLDGKIIFRERFDLSRTKNSISISGLLDADRVGLKSLRFTVNPIDSEKNIANNQRLAAIEVIDEQTKIALISSIAHPDLGAIKRAIEKNEQRVLSFVDPGTSIEQLDEYDFFILYQPNSQFREVFEFLKNKGLGYFLFTGTATDWSFLNSIQEVVKKESFKQTEEVLPIKNEAYSVFDISNLNVVEYPPLKTQLGEYEFMVPQQILLSQKIRGVNLESPLLSTFEVDGIKNATLFGENLWQWRAQTYRENRSFEKFDNFLGQLVRYLADNTNRNRLEINYEPIFNSAAEAKISAAFFDKAYNFESESDLVVRIREVGSSEFEEIPMILKSNSFEADLSNFESGDYEFSVTELNDKITRTGSLKILDFDLEGQSTSANVDKLTRAAQNNRGKLFYPAQLQDFTKILMDDNRFIPIQKSIKNLVSLIDFKWLLALLAVSLTLEWFIRKYNGLL